MTPDYYPRDWRDEQPPYYRVAYGNGQVSAVLTGTKARGVAEDHAIRTSGSAYVETYVVGSADAPGEWRRAK